MRSPKGKGSALAANDVSRTAGAMMSLELTARGSGGARVRRGALRRLRAAPPARRAAPREEVPQRGPLLSAEDAQMQLSVGNSRSPRSPVRVNVPSLYAAEAGRPVALERSAQ